MTITRPHRVDLDWLVERISLHPLTHIQYVNTKELMADSRSMEVYEEHDFDSITTDHEKD